MGGGQFPLILARAARAAGRPAFAAAHVGETDPALEPLVDRALWVKVGQLQPVLDFFHDHNVGDVVLGGRITKADMFSSFDPDERALALLAGLQHFNDDHLLRALADEMGREGFRVVPASGLAPELAAPAGVLTRREPTAEEWEDIRFGWEIAKRLGELDVGQCAVVRQKAVMALEAVDGSDATIRRGGGLAREKAVVVKVVKPGQDIRFDLPSVGLETVRVMAEVQASVLAVEAGRTLMFDRAALIEEADRAGMAVVALEQE